MRKIWLAVAAVSLPLNAHAAKFDPPDLNLEYRLHRDFQNQKGSQGNLSPMGISEQYSLQKGETLWTLSQMLYGDGQYWPRVWAQNKAIANPHLVRPGHQLQFMLGSEDDTPAFRFSEDGGDAGLELVAGPGNQIVDIPPPEVPPKPILKVPSSFPEWQSVFRKRPDQFLDDSGIADKRIKQIEKIYLRAYVQEKPVKQEAVGEFMENDSEAGLPITNQYVYVKVKKGAGQPGLRMLVVRDGGQLMRLNKQWNPKKRPYLVQITAEIELREMTPAKFESEDKKKFDAYRAIVKTTTGLSQSDGLLIPGRLQSITLERKGSPSTGQAQVIGSEKHQASAMFGPGDLVFLDKGSGGGIEVGQLLDVYADRTIRRNKAVVTHSPAVSGTIKVVKVSGNVSTAVLLTATDSIQQGDLAREVASHTESSEELDPFQAKDRKSMKVDEMDKLNANEELDLGEEF